MRRGKFITFEGGEGAGKSTQAKLLARRLGAGGIDAVLTREPGGSPMAEDIRGLLLASTIGETDPVVETLLFYAARADHLAVTIRPALAAGRWVISDRFSDSTRAYQGADADTRADHMLDQLEALVVGADRPDLTLLLDLPADQGLARVTARRQGQGETLDRFEGRTLDFHVRLRDRYLAIARSEPDRIVVIDARGDPAVVHDRIWPVVTGKFSPERA